MLMKWYIFGKFYKFRMVTYTAVGEICFKNVISCNIVKDVECGMIWFKRNKWSKNEI
jgi:hypothetical protein